MNPKRIAIVFNPVGGSAKSGTVNRLQERLKTRCATVELFATTAEPGSGTQLAAQAVREGYDLVIANGGDGTACQVAEALIGTNVAMAVFPGGTGNLFARSFYAVPTVEQFVDMIFAGQPQPLDMVRMQYTDIDGRDHDRLFMVAMGLGKISDAISDADPKWKRIFGTLTYAYRVAKASLAPNGGKFQITCNGATREFHAIAVFGLNVAPPTMSMLSRGCNASDGLLDLAIISGRGFRHVLTTAFCLMRGRPDNSAQFARFRTNDVTIRSTVALRPNIDGDPSPATKELRMRVEPAAVQVLVC